MVKGVRWLITGERDWDDRALIDLFLMRQVRRFEERLVIVHGHCPTGADHFADEFCKRYGVACERFPVVHSVDGPWPAAGPRRNGRMVNSGPFEGGNAFWSGKAMRSGTRDCMTQATEAGIPIEIVPRKFAAWRRADLLGR